MGSFKDVVGHRDIINYIGNAVSMDQVSHAYILNGERGTGKKMLAHLFAMTLLCEKKGTGPCNECHSCKQADSGNHPDIIRVTHDKPNSIGVDDIRVQVNNTVMIKPYQGPYKIYIIDRAELMTVEAQNALLKTIEEPPAYAVILLLTANADSFLPTILSRCIRLNLMPVADEKIREYLMKHYQIPDYQAEISVAFAQGNVGKAIQLASSDHFNELKDSAVQLVKRIKSVDVYELGEVIKQISEYKLSINDYLDIMMVWYRDVLMYKATMDINGLIFKEHIYDIKKQASNSSYHGIQKILKALDKAKIRLNANVNFDIVMELLLLTMKEN